MAERPWVTWKRWWRPLGGQARTEERGGFLANPDSEYGRFAAEKVFAVRELLGGHCLILCGEPGMGKTTEIDALEKSLFKEGHSVIRVSFRSCLDAADFEKKIFRVKRWKTWMRSQGHLYLLVDGVDEGLWLIPNFLEWFIDKLRGSIPLNRLSVILACRTLEWPQDLGRELVGIWAEPPTGDGERRDSIFELCTLTREAAIAAAEAHDVSPNDFLRAVFEGQVEPLAARPLTLFMLLDEFRDKGREFGRTRRELYLQFCKRLCRDTDPERANRLRRRKIKWLDYRPAQLEAVAGRIAAMMLLGAKSSVLHRDGGTPNSTDLLISDIEAGVENDDAGDFSVTEDLLQATRATGLFRGKGSDRFGFEHQTFAECLAARYLTAINLGSLRTILFRRDKAGEHVIPQLAELAAWLAGDREDIFDLLLRTQPEILLRSDLKHLSDTRKRAVVGALLKRAARAEYFEHADRRPFYGELAYTGLAEQLRPTLLDAKLNNTVRWLALDIATACKCRSLFPDLLKILKSDDSISRQAGYALDDLVGQDTAAQLIPIVAGTFTPEQPRPVRVCALRGLVATIWSVAEAMPWAKRLAGSVDFLDWYLADRMKSTDVLGTLRTLSDCKGVFDSLFRLHKVAGRALILGLDQLDFGETKSLMGKMLFQEIYDYRLQSWQDAGDLGRKVETDATIRRALLLEIYRIASTSKSKSRWLMAPLFLPDDLLWLMDCASSSNSAEREQYLEMINWMMRPEVVAPNWDAVVTRITTSPALRSLEAWFGPSNLRNRGVMKVRSEWKKRATRQERCRKQLEKSKLPPREPLIDKALAAGREGKPEAWVSLGEWTFISDSGDWSGGQPYYDIVASPGWKSASEQRRNEIRDLARKFLKSLKKEVRREPNRSTNFSDAAFSAAWLLREELIRPGPLQDVFAKNCVPTIIWGFCSEDSVVAELTALIYFLNPKRGRQLLRQKLRFDADNAEGITLAVRPYLRCWDVELANIVEGFVLEKPRRAETIRSLFAEVAQVDPATIQRIWRLMAARHETSTGTDSVTMAAATELMIELFAEPLWNELYPFLVANPEVVRRSILSSANYGRGYGLTPAPLTEEHLGKLYLLLYQLFPPSDPEERWPDDGEPRRLGSRHAAARVRDSLRDELVSRGTQAACDELKILCSKVGKDDRLWTKKRWLDCVEILRQKEWKPIGISEVAEIARQRNAYWVQSEDDLLIVVNESLDELQRSISNASAGDVIDFWTFKRTGSRISQHKPKSEIDIARIIYSHLREKLSGAHGAIIHREVAVQWDQRRTDIEIIVAAESRRQWREVAVVVEVKRAWNSRIKADVREQLRERYLKRTGRRQGIYLVAWFECDLWKPRRRALKSKTVDAARKEVASICRKASTEEFVITPYVLDCALPA